MGGLTHPIKSILAAGFIVGLVVSPAAADDPPTSPPRHDDGRRTLSRLVPNLGHGAIGVFSKQSLWPLAVGSVATVNGSTFDQALADRIGSPEDGGAQALETAFGGLSAVAVSAVFVAGRFANGARFRAASYDMLVAVAANGAYTFGLKAAVGRERPNHVDKKSFPSGHTSNAFAIAAALDGHYDKKLAIPAYLVASVVGLSRMRLNAHWLSDVLAGATLGYVVGAAVVRVNDRRLSQQSPKAQISVAPLIGPTNGLWLAVSF